MKTKTLRTKKDEKIKYELIENSFEKTEDNIYTIKETLIKGNNLLPKGTLLSSEVFDTLRKANNKFNKIKYY